MRERTLLLIGGGLWLVLMVALGLPHAIWRHLHVDEVQIAFNIAHWAAGAELDVTNYVAPFMVPLSWMVTGFDSSAAMLLILRLCFFLLFAISLVGVAVLQPYFPSARGKLLVLFGITLFHPLWLHGFEIRHDTILVAGSIALYGLAQQVAAHGRSPAWVLLTVGAVAGLMQVNAFKAFLYWIPFAGLILVIATLKTRRHSTSSLRPAALIAAGLVLGLAACLLLLLIAGRLDAYWRMLISAIDVSQSAYRFSAREAFIQLALSSPVVFAGACLFLLRAAAEALRERGRVPWRSTVTAVFLLWNLVVLAVNPTPFSYNFIHVAPFAFLAALDVVARIQLADPESRRLGIAGLLMACLLLFAFHWRSLYYLRHTNEAQLSYIALAEAMTDRNDPVLDGVGLVLSRPAPHPDWMLHSLSMADYQAGKRASFHQIITEDPSPVAIANYRWNWLSELDQQTVAAHYVQVYPRFFVLGAALSSPAGSFEIHRAGRYWVREPTRDLRIDGQPLAAHILELASGEHRYSGAVPGESAVHWIGPRLDALPAVGPLLPGDRLFLSD